MCTRLRSEPRSFTGMDGVIAGRARDHHCAVTYGVDNRLDYQLLFVVGRRRRLTGRAVDDESVVALVDQVGSEPLRGVQIEGQVFAEGRHHGGDHAAQRCSRSCVRLGHDSQVIGPTPLGA